MIFARLCGLLRRPNWREIGLDFGIGLVAVLGQAPFGLWPLALLGLTALLARVAGASTPALAFRRAYLAGAGWFAVGLSWIVQPFLIDPWRYAWMAPFALLLIAFGLALFWGLAAWGARRLGAGAFGFALMLSLAEILRGHIFTGFPWLLPGHIWTPTALIQTASLLGANGMTLVTLVALSAPVALGWRRGLPLLLVIACLAGLWSHQRLSLPESVPRAGLVRLVQPNIAQNLKWDPDEARQNFSRLLEMTSAPSATGLLPELTLWPETAVPYLVAEGEGVALAISDAGQGQLVASGIQRVEGEQAWNSLAVFGPGGRITQRFDKIHLVPFGEYIPLGDLLYRSIGLRAFASQAGAGYSAGETRGLLDFGPALGRALPLICYEAIFPQDLVTEARADWMLQITNDAWFGTLTGPYQHFDLTRLRAVEQGLPLLRVANTGISAVIDARGRVAAEAMGAAAVMDLDVQGVIDAPIPQALPPTPFLWWYGRFGEAPLVLAALLGLAMGAGLRRKRHRA